MDFIEFGLVSKPQGIRGEIKIRHSAADDFDLGSLKAVYLKENGAYNEYPIQSMREGPGFAYIKLEGIEDRNEAEKKRNTPVYIRKQDAPLPEDTHYISDLVGIKVLDDTGKPLGILTEVIETGSADVYVVKDTESSFMFPALKRVILKTDIEAKTMVLKAQTLAEVAVYAV